MSFREGRICRVGRTAPVGRSALYSLLLPPFGLGSVTVFDPALLRASPSQKPACDFPAQASSARLSPDLSTRLLWAPCFHLCVWPACPSSRRRTVSPFAQRALPRLRARMGTSDFQSDVGLPPSLLVVPPYPRAGGSLWISRVPDSALMTCHGLRPRWARQSPGV